MSTQNDILIAYFSVHNTNDDAGYIGGMLVIDDSGVPQEFRCTLPVRPTVPQRALYGNTLEPYVFNELIGLPLTQSLTSRPKCYVVDHNGLLNLRESVALPVIHLEKYGEGLSTDASSDDRHRLDSDLGGYQPITARMHPSHNDDYESVRGIFDHTSNRIDLLEPFERIATAIKVLSERDNRFK